MGWDFRERKKIQNENTELSPHETLASACPPHIRPVLSGLGRWYLAKPPPPPAPVTPGQGLLLPRLLLWVLPVSSPVWTLPPAALASGRRQPRGRNQQLYGHVNYKCRSCYDRGRPGGSARTLLEGAARLQEGLPKGWARAPRMTQRGGSILGGGSRRRSRVCTCPAGSGSLCKVQVFRCGNPSLNSLGGQLRVLN